VRGLVTAAAVLCCLGGLAGAAPSQKLARARAEYQRGQYAQVVQTLEPEVQKLLITERDELVEARYLLAVAYFYLERREEARREFVNLLYLDPDHSLDPAIESPDVYAFFETVKKDLGDQLEQLRRQKQKEAEERGRPSRERLIERTIREPASAIGHFVPLGYGQFRNGQTGKGVFFLTSQALTGGASLALFTYQAVTYGIPSTYSEPGDRDRLRTLQFVQIGTGAAFLALYGWSVIDSFVNERPRIEEKVTERPLTSSRLEVVPLLAPDVVGASASWRF
jgi:tetratricopeptide (TPR) repeat protein